MTRLIAGALLERPERFDEVDLDDLAPGPAREVVALIGRRRAAGLAADAGALLSLEEVERLGPAIIFDLVEEPFLQASLPAYLAEARQLAADAELRRYLTAGPAEPGALRAVADRLEAVEGGAGFLRLAAVAEREIEWFWPGRLAFGNVTVIAGDGGVGKSTLAQEIGARITRGQAPPGGEGGRARAMVLLTAEEDAAAVVRPRMRLMGANLERVVILDPDAAVLTIPSGAERLAARCRAEDAGMVVIDTGPAFLDRGLKSNTEEDVRRFLAPLRALAEELRAVVVVLAHLNKDSTRSAGHRIMGGAAWRNAPRQVLMVGAPPGEDPRQTGERLVAVEKNNLGVYPDAVAFRLASALEDPSQVALAWGREVAGIRSGDLVGDGPSGQERSEREEAVDFLREELADGSRPVAELEQAARAAGLGWATVKKAKTAAGIASRRVGGAAGAGAWEWSLAKGDAPPSPLAASSPVPLSENPHDKGIPAPSGALRGTDSETVPLSGENGSASVTPDDLDRWSTLAGERPWCVRCERPVGRPEHPGEPVCRCEARG